MDLLISTVSKTLATFQNLWMQSLRKETFDVLDLFDYLCYFQKLITLFTRNSWLTSHRIIPEKYREGEFESKREYELGISKGINLLYLKWFIIKMSVAIRVHQFVCLWELRFFWIISIDRLVNICALSNLRIALCFEIEFTLNILT